MDETDLKALRGVFRGMLAIFPGSDIDDLSLESAVFKGERKEVRFKTQGVGGLSQNRCASQPFIPKPL